MKDEVYLLKADNTNRFIDKLGLPIYRDEEGFR